MPLPAFPSEHASRPSLRFFDCGSWEGVSLGVGSVVLFLLVVARMSELVAQVQDQAAQLAALAHNDALTGIPNRRAWAAWSWSAR